MSDKRDHKHTDETPDVSHIHTPGVAHEDTDVKAGPVAKFTVALAILLVVTGGLMWLLFSFLARVEQRKEPPPSSLTRERRPNMTPEEIFPEPRLQRNPVLDLDNYLAEEQSILNNYGWIDQAAGTVRIPIEQAKKLVVERGLPVSQQPADSRQGSTLPQGGVTGDALPSDSSSGHTLERRQR